MKPVFTIVCYNQFGYLTDTFEYCKYLTEKYHIEYLCIDSGQKKLTMNSVSVSYFKTTKTGATKWLAFMQFCRQRINKNSEVLFVKYSLFCSLLAMKYRNKAIFDVRTGSLKKNIFSRALENKLIQLESKAFKHKTVISHSLAKLIGISEYKLLPLGGNERRVANKDFINAKKISLLYIGTFSGRNLDVVLRGLSLFLSDNPQAKNIELHMVGDGYNNELEELSLLSKSLNLTEYVTFHGRVPYNQTAHFFEKCNVGVSFVPKTPFFDVQPVTKTYEYIAAGMPVIATSTTENNMLITNEEIGELCNDNDISFSHAITNIVKNFEQYNSSYIKDQSGDWSWNKICQGLSFVISEIKYVNK